MTASADYGNVFPAVSFWRARQETPGFAVFFELGARFAPGVGIEADAFATADGFDRDDVPDVVRDNVSNEEIDFGGSVGNAAGSGGFDAVAGFGIAGGGFNLDAEESLAEFDDGVVALAISPRKADGESEMGGAGEEGGFGGFSTTLARGQGYGLEFDISIRKIFRGHFPLQVLNIFRPSDEDRRGRTCCCAAVSGCNVALMIRFVLLHNRKGATGGSRLSLLGVKIYGLKDEKRGPKAALCFLFRFYIYSINLGWAKWTKHGTYFCLRIFALGEMLCV